LEVVGFNIKNVINKTIREISVIARSKGLDVMYYTDPDIPEKVFGDPVRLSQILINLTSNALKFTEHGHIYFKVKQLWKNGNNIKLELSVEDTGVGVDDSFKENIFKIFTQAESSYTRKYGETGLVHAISKNLVNMMNGDIWFESQLEKGSTFYFTAEFALNE
jgi:signal transduction histidine kinase